MRKMLILAIGSFLVGLLLQPAPIRHTSAQDDPDQLPADLIFTTDIVDAYYYDSFVWVDAQTLQAVPFYTDNTGYVDMRPISWSPDGHYLAFLYLGDWQACILTRDGVLQSCFEDKILRWDGFRFAGKDYMVTWSEDEQKAYLVTDNGESRSLIEADVATGQTLRTLYQYDLQDEWPPKMYWTPSLDYLAIFDEEEQLYGTGFLEAVYAYDVTVIRLATNETFTMPTELPELGTLSFCPQFSPLGHYLIAQGGSTEFPPPGIDFDWHLGFAIFDPVGNLISTLPNSRFEPYSLEWVVCPTWQANEQAFYFLGGTHGDGQSIQYTASIFKYAVPDDTLTLYAQIEPPDDQHETGTGGYPLSPLIVSPEGTHIAIGFGDVSLGPGESVNEVGVLFPSGELIRFNDPFIHSLNPIWVPPALPE